MGDVPVLSSASTISLEDLPKAGDPPPEPETDFEHTTYVQLMTQYIEVYGLPRPERGVRLSADGKSQWARRKEPELYSSRPVNIADLEDYCLHILMLHRPTRRDVDRWIFRPEDLASKFSSMVQDFFTIEQLRGVAPALATLFEGLGGVEAVTPLRPGQRRIDMMSLEAPEVTELSSEQKDMIFELFGAYGFGLSGPQLIITGPAGSGKSWLLWFFIRYFTNRKNVLLFYWLRRVWLRTALEGIPSIVFSTFLAPMALRSYPSVIRYDWR
jgi:hypothetical protein